MIKQSSLQKFQEEMETVMKDPYKVVMKQSKLPMSLLHDRVQPHVSRGISRAHSTQIPSRPGWPWPWAAVTGFLSLLISPLSGSYL